jgi:uncharacterized protein YutE (UPF0331/DUF86 family)
VNLIERKIGTVQERVGKLEELSRSVQSFDEYRSSANTKDIVERNLQVALEACLDIAKIVISQKGLSEPKDNQGLFVVLAEANVISEESLKFLVPMAGTRNILVHGYDKVDDSVIYGVIKKHLGDFYAYLKEVKDNYLATL